jgi:two-component system, NarL family, sensor histidine kinase DegS
MILSPSEIDQFKGADETSSLNEDVQKELDLSNRELQEIGLKLEQSQTEVNKLAQRNAAITAHLQQIQGQFDSTPRAEIRTSYDAALDAQQRLFVMRGQLEKLLNDRSRLERYKELLQRVSEAMELMVTQKSASKVISSMGQTVEMMVQAQEAERQRLARQMHDEPAQALSNFILQTEIALRLFDIDQAKAKEELVSLKTSATTTFQKIRDFIFELRPMMLDDLGLSPTLNRYVEAFKEQTGLDVRLTISGLDQRLEPYLEVMIFRAIQELLGNAARHSQASLIKVQVDSSVADVRVTVEDNGKGFDANLALEHGMGVKIIRERIEMLNGRMEVDSVIGQGTRISFQIPAVKTKVFA